MNRFYRYLCGALLTALLSSGQEARAGSAWVCVDQLVKNLAQDKTGAAALLIDYDEMSRRTLGKQDWQSMTPGQKHEFTRSLKALVEKRYYPRWRKIFARGKVALVDEKSNRGDVLVSTVLTIGKKSEPLSWRVTDRPGNQRVVSLAVADRDLVERIKHRIDSRRKKGNLDIDQLIAWIASHKGEVFDGASLAQSGDKGVVVSD